MLKKLNHITSNYYSQKYFVVNICLNFKEPSTKEQYQEEEGSEDIRKKVHFVCFKHKVETDLDFIRKVNIFEQNKYDEKDTQFLHSLMQLFFDYRNGKFKNDIEDWYLQKTLAERGIHIDKNITNLYLHTDNDTDYENWDVVDTLAENEIEIDKHVTPDYLQTNTDTDNNELSHADTKDDYNNDYDNDKQYHSANEDIFYDCDSDSTTNSEEPIHDSHNNDDCNEFQSCEEDNISDDMHTESSQKLYTGHEQTHDRTLHNTDEQENDIDVCTIDRLKHSIGEQTQKNYGNNYRAIHEHIENVLDKHYYDIRNSDNDSDYDEYLRNTFYVCPDKDKEASKLNSLILPQVLMIL